MADAHTPPAASPRWERVLAALLTAWYGVRLLDFAVSIGANVPPDESTHLALAELYSRVAWMPVDSPASWPLGLVSHRPYLYHLLEGKLLWANVFGASSGTFLRLTNVALAFVTLAFAWRLARALLASPVARLLFLVLVTNTVMWTFLSASISYDNLTNLLAVAAVWAVVRHVQDGDPRHAWAALLAMGLGALTKVTFVPLIPILLAPWLWDRRASLANDAARMLAAVRTGAAGARFLAAATLLAGIAVLGLYGENLVRYRTPVPTCEQILPIEACLENRIFARNWVVDRFRRGELGLDEALLETARIRHAGDRAYAELVLRQADKRRRRKVPLVNRWDYAFTIWERGIKPSIFGVLGHVQMLRGRQGLLPYNVVLLVAGVLIVRGVRFRGPERVGGYLAFVVLAYGVFYVIYSYGGYAASGTLGFGVQGRYVFPVLVPAYLLMACHLLRPFPRPARIVVAAGVAALFLTGDMPWFQRNARPRWYTDLSAPEASAPSPSPTGWP